MVIVAMGVDWANIAFGIGWSASVFLLTEGILFLLGEDVVLGSS
jgi:hypothetical protein